MLSPQQSKWIYKLRKRRTSSFNRPPFSATYACQDGDKSNRDTITITGRNLSRGRYRDPQESSIELRVNPQWRSPEIHLQGLKRTTKLEMQEIPHQSHHLPKYSMIVRVLNSNSQKNGTVTFQRVPQAPLLVNFISKVSRENHWKIFCAASIELDSQIENWFSNHTSSSSSHDSDCAGLIAIQSWTSDENGQQSHYSFGGRLQVGSTRAE